MLKHTFMHIPIYISVLYCIYNHVYTHIICMHKYVCLHSDIFTRVHVHITCTVHVYRYCMYACVYVDACVFVHTWQGYIHTGSGLTNQKKIVFFHIRKFVARWHVAIPINTYILYIHKKHTFTFMFKHTCM